MTPMTDPYRGSRSPEWRDSDGQNALCNGPEGYHDRNCWLDKNVCAFVLACICSPRNTRPCPSHSRDSSLSAEKLSTATSTPSALREKTK